MTVSIASVAISAGIFVNVTLRPLIRPISAPTPRLAPIAAATGTPKSLTNPTDRTDESASTAPTERSMPATMMTKDSPIAITAMTVEEKSRFSILRRVKNTGLKMLSAIAPMRNNDEQPKVLDEFDCA